MRPDKQYSVRSVALRGDNDETLEVCIAAEESDSLQESEAESAACSACPRPAVTLTVWRVCRNVPTWVRSPLAITSTKPPGGVSMV